MSQFHNSVSFLVPVCLLATAVSTLTGQEPRGSNAQRSSIQEQRAVCFQSGRRVQCSFTVIFDARTEQFTTLRATRSSSGATSTSVSLPVDRFSIPILTGDVITVEVQNLPYGDRVDASASGTPATPFPRPSLNETFTLSTLNLGSLAAPALRLEQSTPFVIEAADFRNLSPAEFKAKWTSEVRNSLPHVNDAVQKLLDEVTPSLQRTLLAQARTLESAGPALVAQLNRLTDQLKGAETNLGTNCPEAQAGGEARDCPRYLEEASSVASRQAGLQVSVQQLIATLDLKAAGEAAGKVSTFAEHPDARFVLDHDLFTHEQLVGPAFPAFANAAQPTEAELANVRTLLAGTRVVQQLAQDESRTAVEFVNALSQENLLRLRENLLFTSADAAGLRKYQEFRTKAKKAVDDTRSAVAKIKDTGEGFEAARVEMALATTNLAFTFDQAAARLQPALRIPVFRTTGDEDVTITLTRSPRFTVLPQGASIPSTNATADKAAAQTAAVPSRTYTTKLLGRKKHFFQLTAGFAFSGIQSWKYGTVDRTEQVDQNGDGTTENATVRRITRTSDRPRMFLPVAQMVFHPLGKDLHPDAYKNWHAFVPGIALGTALDSPQDNFSLGLDFEPLPGLHLSGGWLWSHVQDLQEGFAVTDQIPATAVAPTRDRFKDGWYAGGMLDLSVFTGFFGKLLGIGG